MFILRLILAVIAIVLIAVGIVAFIAPTPFGFIVLGIGFVLLAVSAPGLVRGFRKRWKWLDRIMYDLEKHAPGWLARRLKESDPPEDEDETTQDESEDNADGHEASRTRDRADS
ncbi:MAG: hypothetical protein AAGC77_12925 [Pseudomonadota bacterium]